MDYVVIRIEFEVGATFLVKQKGDVSGIEVVRVPQEDVVPSRECLCAVATVPFPRPSADETVPLTVKGRIDNGDLLPSRIDHLQRVSKRPAGVHVVGERLALEKGTVPHQHAVGDRGLSGDLDLVAGVALGVDAAEDDATAQAVIEQVQAVGGVVQEGRVLDNPVSSGGTGADAVPVTPGRLGPAAGRLAAGVGLATAVPLHRPAAEDERAGVRVVAFDVTLPADPAVARDTHVLHRPVGEAAGANAGRCQAVDVQVTQVDVGRFLGVEAAGGPVSEGEGVTLASQATGVVFHAAGVIGDLQAGDLDVAGVGEVEDHSHPLGAPQLGRVGAAGVPAGAQDAGRMRRVRAAGDRWHVAVPGVVGCAVVGSGRAVAHRVTAGGDDQRIAAGDARRAVRRECAEGVVPGAGLGGPAAGVRRVHQAGALFRGAPIGAHVVGGKRVTCHVLRAHRDGGG